MLTNPARLSKILDRMYIAQDDYVQNVKKGSKYKSIELLTAWFGRYTDLSATWLSRAAGVNIWTIRKWRTACGYGKPPNPNFIKGVKHTSTVLILAPHDWETHPTWLAKAVTQYSVSAIAKAVRVPIGRLYKILDERQIPKFSKAHPLLSDKAWLAQQVEGFGRGPRQIAKLYKLNAATVQEWIWRHDLSRIPTWVETLRHQIQAFVKPLGGRVAAPNLKLGRLVVELPGRNRHLQYIRRGKLAVNICPKDLGFRPIPLRQTYYDVLEPEKFGHMRELNTRQFRRASPLEQRLAKWELFIHCSKRSYGRPEYPWMVVDEELQACREKVPDLKLQNGICQFKGNIYKLGHKILYQFCDPTLYEDRRYFPKFPIEKAWKTAFEDTLRQLLRASKTVITTEQIHRKFILQRGPTLIGPQIYRAIFGSLEVSSVIDLDPVWGNKALACALLGVPYYPVRTRVLEEAFGAGFAEYIGLQWEWFDGQHGDLLVADGLMRIDRTQDAWKYAGQADRIMAYAAKPDQFPEPAGKLLFAFRRNRKLVTNALSVW